MIEPLELRSVMRRTVHIQRLNKPTGHLDKISFGGGYMYGGFTRREMERFKDVFSFEYMGSSNYEYGEVAAAWKFLDQLADNREIVSGLYSDVYYIAPHTYEENVKNFIDQLIADERSLRLADHCCLAESLEKKNPRNVGWLEITNGFFFFTDRVMFEKTKMLLGI